MFHSNLRRNRTPSPYGHSSASGDTEMKSFLTALSGGIVGAVIVLAAQSGGFDIIKHVKAGSIDPWIECYVDGMENIHTEGSEDVLAKYCQQKTG
jgi:hypothetical protein